MASTTRLEQLRVSVGPPPLVVPRNVTTILWWGYERNAMLVDTVAGDSSVEK